MQYTTRSFVGACEPRYPGCAPREAASRRMNAKQIPSFRAQRDHLVVIGPVSHDSAAVQLCRTHLVLEIALAAEQSGAQ